ncbi:MAG: transglutaminase-like domain-containing protein [Acidobacteria bacterium]|nr:transglutaminase-like domain-containing protein [Acidobacteriota bacterium]
MEARTQADVLELFRALAELPEEAIEPVEGALLIAQSEYPSLDRSQYRRQLYQMAFEAHEVCTGGTAERLRALSRLFGGRWGFRGNHEDYYDPRNSFLNDVLDRRTGIPITLALVYIEAGRGAGLDLLGVGMPGHFLVGMAGREDIYVDAFGGGALLTRADCAARMRELHPEEVFRPEFLAPVSPRQILVRMLNNLLEIYLQTDRFAKALAALEMILCLEQEQAHWLRRRALVHSQLKNYSRAIADLEAYLAQAPDAPDRAELERHLAALRQLRSLVN